MKLYYLSSSAFSDNQMSILKHLSKRYEVTYGVIIPHINSNYTKSELSAFCKTNGIRFEAFELKHRFRNPRLIAAYVGIIRAVKQAKPDVVYFANFDQLYLNALLLLLNRFKTVIALHDVESHSKTAFNKLVGISKNILIRRFKHFHTYSTIQQSLLQTKVPKKNVFNVSLPLIDFGPLPTIVKEKDIVNFLFFGNILYYKGLDVLLPVFNKVAAKYPNARLTIAGRCKDWKEVFEPLVANNKQVQSHIRFIQNEEIPLFYSTADYVVLPYRDTTQSGPLMIAFNYNVPVLVSSAEGFKEFTVEGVTGYSFSLSNEGEIEALLEACMKRNAKEYNDLKQKLAAYTETNFSMQALVRKYDRMFAKVQGN